MILRFKVGYVRDVGSPSSLRFLGVTQTSGGGGDGFRLVGEAKTIERVHAKVFDK